MFRVDIFFNRSNTFKPKFLKNMPPPSIKPPFWIFFGKIFLF
ncbi:MAG: hypothetical protein RL757_3353 [Bacteroidota bacterium]